MYLHFLLKIYINTALGGSGCPAVRKNSHIWIVRKPVFLSAGSGMDLCHIERLGLPKMRKRSESHFPLCLYGRGEALATKLTLRRWSSQLSLSGLSFAVRGECKCLLRSPSLLLYSILYCRYWINLVLQKTALSQKNGNKNNKDNGNKENMLLKKKKMVRYIVI